MSEVDITVVVTAHDETVVSGPTMAAADAAIAAAESAGFRVERIVALDSPTPACRAYFGQSAFDAWQRTVLDLGDVGAVRNTMAESAAGRLLAFLDADDLCSENWLVEGSRRVLRAEGEGVRAIAHPELNWIFDGAASVLVKPEQTDRLFSPYYLYSNNYYDSLCLAPRAAHLEVPYVRRQVKEGFSYQDWQFNIETMARGWCHVTARDTIIFKRRRDSSLVTESAANRTVLRPLEAMAIDRIGQLPAGHGPAAPEAEGSPPETG